MVRTRDGIVVKALVAVERARIARALDGSAMVDFVAGGLCYASIFGKMS
jgi:hypothetical protein